MSFWTGTGGLADSTPGYSLATLRVAVAILSFCFLATLNGRAAAGISPDALEFFENKIRPVLAQDCYECHRTGGKKKGGLALDHRQALLDGGDSGKAIVPGNPGASLLIRAIRHEREDLQMPKSRAKLEPAIIADFEKWIRIGAPDPRDRPASDPEVASDTNWDAVLKRRKAWWSFQPIRTTDLTTLPLAATNHPIDRFIRAKLLEAGLTPAGPADRRALLRRLSFALRGLPPTPEEIDSFLTDSTPDGYLKQVDKFLDSPRFGECWARHWMDWIRYADSHGSEGDPDIPYAWRYRDYLIRALNDDVPYDQLVREHLAGDLLEPPRLNPRLGLVESSLGIGHLRMVFHGFAPTDPLEEQVRFTEDQISAVSKAFLGLTVGCARCHNHKFDPISQKDFYSLYGIFVSCPPATIAVDAPRPEVTRSRENLAEQKNRIREALAEIWAGEADHLAVTLQEPGEALKRTIGKAQDPKAVLHPFFLMQGEGKRESLEAALSTWRKNAAERTGRVARSYARRWDLTDPAQFGQWRRDASGVLKPIPAGAFALAPAGDPILVGIYPAGVYSHLTSAKDRAVVLSPRFALDQKYDLWVRVLGDGGAVARYAVQNYPRDGSIYPVTRLSGGQWRWLKFPLDYWEGDRIHLELTTAADQPVLADQSATRSWFGLREVVLTKSNEPAPAESPDFAEPVLAEIGERPPSTTAELSEAYAAALRKSAKAWAEGRLTDGQALFLDQLRVAGVLPNSLTELPAMKNLIESYRAVENSLPVPTRAPGVLETDPIDQPIFERGNHKQPGPPVERRFLEVLATSNFSKNQSGRRELAEEFLGGGNRLVARVIVNRIWYHLFGRGIVPSTDNFGRLGQEPTHPELLDFLAHWFVEHGYSIKALVRFLVTSQTWQSSSEPPPGAVQRDPENTLFSHARLRRLEAEAIRDALLGVAGDLQAEEMFGPPITGRTPRRSIYLRVKRNDLDPFLSTFDAPVPASTTGQRDVTNVPGQSLTLLNDPFVIELAEHWGERIRKEAAPADPRGAIEAMFGRAFGRPPTGAELERAKGFLELSVRQRAEDQQETARLQEEETRCAGRLAGLAEAVRKRVVLKRHDSAPAGASPLPEPIAEWRFENGMKDERGGLAGHSFGQAKVEKGGLVLDGARSFVTTAPLTKSLKTKTLEAWVQLDNLDQQGGGVMTVQSLNGEVFDAIVIGEQERRRWLAGSDEFHRTQAFQGPPEAQASLGPVHLAIAYHEDGTIAGYRNGRPYGQVYKSNGPALFEAGKAQVLFGNRHGQPGGNKNLAGKIYRARLYDRALTAAEVAAVAAGDPTMVSHEELLTAMTREELQEYRRLHSDAALLENRRQKIARAAGLSSEWGDLAHALFNLKEFIYVR